MPPKGKGSSHARKRGREPSKGQMGIMSFFGRNGVRAAAPGSEPIPGEIAPIPCKATSATVVDVTGGSNGRRHAPPTKARDSRGNPPQSATEIIRKSSPATLARDSSGGTSGACSGALNTTVLGSSRSAAGGRGSPSGVGFMKASDLVHKDQLQRGTRSTLQTISARKETAAACSPRLQETVDFSPSASLPPSLNECHGTNHPASAGGVGKRHNARRPSQEVEVFQEGSTVVPAPGNVNTAASTDADARRSFSWGSLCSSSGKRDFGGRDHSSDPIVLPLHVVGLKFRDVPPSDQHHDNNTSPTAVKPDTALVLERESCNSYDENAIKVLLPASLGSRFLGYIPGRVAALLAPIIDAASGTVARVALKIQKEESVVGRQTLPAVLEVQPLSGANRESFAGSLAKLREAAKKEEKRRQKRLREASAHTDRLRSRQKSLLLDFGRSISKSRGSATDNRGTARGGGMLESMPREVLWEIFCSPGISSRELFGPIRAVCRNWLQAVDAMPCARARRRVALACAGQTLNSALEHSDQCGDDLMESRDAQSARRGLSGDGELVEGKGVSGSFASLRGLGMQAIPLSTSLDFNFRVEGSDSSSAGVRSAMTTGESSTNSNNWWNIIRSRLVGGGGFTECDAEGVLWRLEWAAEQDEDDAMARRTSDDPPRGGDDDGVQEVNSGPGAQSRARRNRVLEHLAATRALCAEWGLVSRDGAVKVRGRDTAGGSSGSIGNCGTGSWSGWEALALALVTSSSRDMLTLCCWAIRPLMGSGNGSDLKGEEAFSCPGLPRSEVIELLCVMLCALRALEENSESGLPLSSTRLKGDLLVCTRMLENRDLRFEKPGLFGGGASGLLSSLTSEQRSIILTDVKPGEVLTVLAFAGTGKTTCLRAYAQARPHLRILYLTFNVSVRQEAEKTFPPHVDCKGVHQLAFQHVGRRFHSKLTQDLREADMQEFLKRSLGKEVKLSEASRVLAALSAFFASASPSLSSCHVKPPPSTTPSPGGSGEEEFLYRDQDRADSGPRTEDSTARDGHCAAVVPSGWARGMQQKPPPSADEQIVLQWAKLAWSAMQIPGSKPNPRRGVEGDCGGGEERGFLGMTHAGYLKLFQLSGKLLGRTYDVIMLDEAQDSNPCIADIVLREAGCGRILVGDSHQAIYGFIGAEDHLKAVEGGKVRYLTQVFRFDQGIAHVANVLVGLKGESRPLLGCPGKTSEVAFFQEGGFDVWHDQGCRVTRPFAFLARTVASLIQAATLATTQGQKVAWIGGAQAYNLEAVEDMCLMAIGRSKEVRHSLLKKLKSIKALIRFVQESGDRQWSSRLRMLECRDPGQLLTELNVLQRKQVTPRDADVILSTVHKAKGLEFDTVVLADDFMNVTDLGWTVGVKRKPLGLNEEEVNILYVAVTRAKRKLVPNSTLSKFFAYTGSWDSVCLRGVSTLRDKKRSSTSLQTHAGKCACCSDRLTGFGSGDKRTRRVSKNQALEISAKARTTQPQGGTVFPTVHDGVLVGQGLLYAMSGSLRPLCCWCVEEGWDDVIYIPELALPRCSYAKAFMRGVDSDGTP